MFRVTIEKGTTVICSVCPDNEGEAYDTMCKYMDDARSIGGADVCLYVGPHLLESYPISA